MPHSKQLAPELLTTALSVAGQAMFEQVCGGQEDEIAWSDAGAAMTMFGVTNTQAVSSEADIFVHVPDEYCVARSAAIEAAERGATSYCVEYPVRTGPADRWIEERGMVISVAGMRRIIGSIRSIDDQKKREDSLHHRASFDDLTGQLNRVRFRELVEAEVNKCHGSGSKSTVMLVGIDGVGQINGDFGFEIADEVIVAVARRLKSAIEGYGVCGRVAGTKFGVLINDGETDNVVSITRQIMTRVREKVVPTSAGGVAVSVCVGASTITQRTASSGSVLSEAEAAFDQARRKGPSSFASFSEQTDKTSRRQQNQLISDTIISALNERRMYLVYQPIVSDIKAPHTKYECLARLEDECGNEVPAPSFIPAAERLGLVHLLDRRVLELATQTLSEVPGIALNVNLSWETVRDPVWAEGYLAHLRASRRVCDRLTIELTETQAIEGIETSIEFVAAIKSLGCKFAMDDFGAGYTSFRNLKALDIDVLKIDGSFVSGLANSRENQLFVRTLLDLARNFEMQTVAEWVDNEADATLLKALGVDYLQGYFIGKPERRQTWTKESQTATSLAG